ncbi:MAG: type II toxin-antitoxin system RelE/ParE family toxin [Dehalococcoidia bacterium]
MPYRLDYSPEAVDHLRHFVTAAQRATILDAIVRRLAHEPTVETRNRKPMLPNPIASWELRVGALRVYYDVVDQPEPIVYINAIGIKHRNRILIAGEEIEL